MSCLMYLVTFASLVACVVSVFSLWVFCFAVDAATEPCWRSLPLILYKMTLKFSYMSFSQSIFKTIISLVDCSPSNHEITAQYIHFVYFLAFWL